MLLAYIILVGTQHKIMGLSVLQNISRSSFSRLRVFIEAPRGTYAWQDASLVYHVTFWSFDSVQG